MKEVQGILHMRSKPGFPSFFFEGVIIPSFHICGICPNLMISLKRTDKGYKRKALIRRNGISKG